MVERPGKWPAAAALSAQHAADAVHQQPAADHAGRCRRSGPKKRPTAATAGAGHRPPWGAAVARAAILLTAVVLPSRHGLLGSAPGIAIAAVAGRNAHRPIPAAPHRRHRAARRLLAAEQAVAHG